MQEALALQCLTSSLSSGAKDKIELKSKIPLSTLFSPSSHSSAIALVWEAMTCLRKEIAANTLSWILLPWVLAPEQTVVHLLLLLVRSREYSAQKAEGMKN